MKWSILDTSMFRTAPQLDRTMSKKAESTSFTTQKKTPLPKKRQVSTGGAGQWVGLTPSSRGFRAKAASPWVLAQVNVPIF